jgi:hypothetical protein
MKTCGLTPREEVLFHAFTLARIFPNHTAKTARQFYAGVQSLESLAHDQAERECNGEVGEAESEAAWGLLRRELVALLGETGVPVIFNCDPRGYALKIEASYMSKHSVAIERDWGGYGILAPDFGRGDTV